MKKVLKITGAAVVLLIAALLILPMALKGKIAQVVKTEANRMLTAQLDFEELDISLLRHFPQASLDLNGLTLVAAGEFEGDTVVAARRISILVSPFSLLGSGGFEVGKVLLDRPEIYGHKAADGAVNWDVMKPSAERAEEVEESAEPSAFRLSLKDVRINDARLRYADDSTRMAAAVDPLTLRLKGDLSAARSVLGLTVKAGGVRYESEGRTLVSGIDVGLKADVDADLEKMCFVLSDNELSVNAIKLAMDGRVEMPEGRMAMDLKLKSSEIGLREVLSLVPAFYTNDFKNLTASGQLSLDAWAKGELAGDVLPAFRVALDVRDGRFKYADLPQAVTGIRVALAAANPGGAADATTVDLSEFAMTMAGQTLRASLHAATPVSDLQFRAAADGRIDLGAVKSVYPLPDSVQLAGRVGLDVKAAGRMSWLVPEKMEKIEASGTLSVEGMQAAVAGLPAMEVDRVSATVSPQALTLDACALKVGRSDLQAKGRLTGYLAWLLRDGLLKGSLTLTSTLIDANELLGLVPEAADTDTPAAAPAESSAQPESSAAADYVRVPGNVDLTLSAAVGSLLFQQMEVKDFTGTLTAREGTLSMDKLHMKAFGGKLDASGRYASTLDVPTLGMNLGFVDASFAETFRQLDMIRKMVPLFARTGGNYSMKFDFTTRMQPDMSPDLMSLNGKGELTSSNIHLQNLEVLDKMGALLKNDKLKNLEAKDVRVGFTVADGRLATKPFDVRLGGTKVTLAGTTGLDSSIDYTATVDLPVAGAVNRVAVGIGGTFASPKLTLDMKEAVKSAVTSQIRKATGMDTAAQAEKIRSEARAAGDKLVAEAEKQRDNLVSKSSNALAKAAARAAGDKLVKEARKQADKLIAEADAKAAKLEAGE